MQLSCDQGRLAVALKAVLPAVPSRPLMVTDVGVLLGSTDGHLEAAQANLARVKAGSSAKEIAVAQAQATAAEAAVTQAEAALQAALAVLDGATLRVPFDGAVAVLNVEPGQTVLPGQVLVVADLQRWQVTTTDLSERDVAEVTAGQSATAFVDPLGVTIEGRVVSVAPEATTVGGDVVYKVIIELDEQLEGLRWGMSAVVEISMR
jgi:HlyD family secretion protein